jgi:hypothetical protein
MSPKHKPEQYIKLNLSRQAHDALSSIPKQELAQLLQCHSAAVGRKLAGVQRVKIELLPALAERVFLVTSNEAMKREVIEGNQELDGVSPEGEQHEFRRHRQKVIATFGERLYQLNKQSRPYEVHCLVYDGGLVTDILQHGMSRQDHEIFVGISPLSVIRTVRMRDGLLEMLHEQKLVKKDMPRIVRRNMALLESVQTGTKSKRRKVECSPLFFRGLPLAFGVATEDLIAMGDPIIARDGTLRAPPVLHMYSRQSSGYARARALFDDILKRAVP